MNYYGNQFDKSISWGFIGGNIFLALILTFWGANLLFQPHPFVPLDYTNTAIHEWSAIFYDVGNRVFVALMQNVVQVVIPFLLALYFLYHNRLTSVIFCVFWMGDNIIQVGLYMADAITMQLNICSLWYLECGDNSFHDWNIIFSAWGLLSKSELIGNSVRLFGDIVVICSILYLYFVIFQIVCLKLVQTENR